jgi:hypothetical protein
MIRAASDMRWGREKLQAGQSATIRALDGTPTALALVEAR